MRKVVLLCLIFSLVSTTGCQLNIGNKTLTAEPAGSIVTKDELTPDYLYVKNGTGFTRPAENPYIREAAQSPSPEDRVIPLFDEDLEQMPTLYRGEAVVIKTLAENIPDTLQVERFKDLGYSAGCFGMTYTDGTRIRVDESKIKDGSQFAQMLAGVTEHKALDITQADDRTEGMLTLAGCLLPKEKGAAYTVTLALGTVTEDTEIIADTHILESSETFVLEDPVLTTLGYVRFSMPEDAKAGYYQIGKYGLIRYCPDAYAEAKTDYPPNEANLFEGITPSLDDFATPERYVLSQTLNMDAEQLKLTVPAEGKGYKVTQMTVSRPDGSVLTAERGNVFSVKIQDALAGAYTIVIKGTNPSFAEVKYEVDPYQSKAEEDAAQAKAAAEAEAKRLAEEARKKGIVTGETKEPVVPETTPAPETTADPIDTIPEEAKSWNEEEDGEIITSDTMRG